MHHVRSTGSQQRLNNTARFEAVLGTVACRVVGSLALLPPADQGREAIMSRKELERAQRMLDMVERRLPGSESPAAGNAKVDRALSKAKARNHSTSGRPGLVERWDAMNNPPSSTTATAAGSPAAAAQAKPATAVNTHDQTSYIRP